MKKNIFWAAIFACVVLISGAVILFGQFSHGTTSAEIYVDGRLYKVIYDLGRQDLQSFRVETEHGYNVICYKSGKIWVSEADCANQTCVKYAKASLVGETIVCAPHKLVIKIVGTDYKKVDAVT
ncbi:MAG: NusG domain II-containing protein [Ruminococcus sp.]|nr:NusG domain II-containing protein [Ruminococcus sp.]